MKAKYRALYEEEGVRLVYTSSQLNVEMGLEQSKLQTCRIPRNRSNVKHKLGMSSRFFDTVPNLLGYPVPSICRHADARFVKSCFGRVCFESQSTLMHDATIITSSISLPFLISYSI